MFLPGPDDETFPVSRETIFPDRAIRAKRPVDTPGIVN
jgi:hypothetical protein